MKVTGIRVVGHFINPDVAGGNPTEIKAGRKANKPTEQYFYIQNGMRVFLTNAEFERDWKLSEV